MKNKRILFVAFACLLSSGCKMDVNPEVYLSDLHSIVESDEAGMTTPAKIAIEIPSANECAKYTEQIANVMQGILDSYTTQGCTQSGMDSHLVLAIEMPLLPFSERTDSLFSIAVGRHQGSSLDGKLVFRHNLICG